MKQQDSIMTQEPPHLAARLPSSSATDGFIRSGSKEENFRISQDPLEPGT